MVFKVTARDFSQEFDRWIDALDTANSLRPKCKSWLEDIRILEGEEPVWVYSKSHKYPMYLGAGTYDRLARLFVAETLAERESQAESQD
jgi:hypothetical protein